MNFWDIAKAIGEGVISIPVDIYYGGRRTLEDVGAFGAQVRKANVRERDRVVEMLQSAYSNRKVFEQLIRIVVFDFVERLPKETMGKLQESLAKSGIKFGTRKATQFALAGFLGTKLTEKIITRAIAKRMAKFGVGIVISAVLLQGLLERSSIASQRLMNANPLLFEKLKKQNLDILYFLAEEELAPYVNFTALQLQSHHEFERILEHLTEQLK